MEDMQIVPAGKKVEAQYLEMMVPLSSRGCERKVNKALSQIKGIYSVNVDYYQQKVTVWGICNKYDVLDTIKMKRKESRFWNPKESAAAEAPAEAHIRCPSQRPSFALMRARSLGWKTVRKVFGRSRSF